MTEPRTPSIDPEPLAIRVRGLRKYFGDVRALDGVDLDVPPGTVLGLLGPNGAGKTTAVRVLATLLQPDAGEVHVAGLDVVRDAARVREQIGLAGQYAAVDENLTGLENLVMVGRLYGMSARRRPRAVASCSSASSSPRPPTVRPRRTPAACAGAWISRRRSSPSRRCCSSTSRRRDSIRAAGSSSGTTIEELVAEGRTVLLTTQYLDEADRLADAIAVIDHGRVIAEGTPDELKDRVGGERLEVRLSSPDQTRTRCAR